MALSSDETRVGMYELLPDTGESDIVHAHIPAGAEILELGCGTGRMTRRLIELGHRVTALDISEVMLRRVPAEASKVQADIDTAFDLERTFQVVLMASHLVDARERRIDRLSSCRRHVMRDGQVLVERWSPGFEGFREHDWEALGDLEIRTSAASREGNEFSAVIEFRAGNRQWSQPLTVIPLDDATLQESAAEAGLVWVGTFTEDGSWVELRPN